MAAVSPTSTGSMDSVISEHSAKSVISKASSKGSHVSETSSKGSTRSVGKTIRSSITNSRSKKKNSKETFLLLTIKRKYILFHGNDDHAVQSLKPWDSSKQPIQDLTYRVYIRGTLVGSLYHRQLDQIKETSVKVNSMDESKDRLVLTSSGSFQLFKANETEYFQERNFNQRVFDQWVEEREMKETLEKEKRMASTYGPEFVEKVTYYTSSTGRDFKIRARKVRNDNQGSDDEDCDVDCSCEKACSCESGTSASNSEN